MRRHLIVCLIVGMLLGGAAFPLETADENAPLLLMSRYRVKPPLDASYEKVIGEIIAHYGAHRFAYPIYSYWFEDFSALFLTPVRDFADVEAASRHADAVLAKMGEEALADLRRRETACTTSMDHQVLERMPRMSYIPEKWKYTRAGDHYTYWAFYRLLPEKEGLFCTTVSELVTYLKTLDFGEVEIGWEMFRVRLGAEQPLYIYCSRGRSMVDFFVQTEKRHAIAGAPLQRFVDTMISCARAYTPKHAWYVRELSHLPGTGTADPDRQPVPE